METSSDKETLADSTKRVAHRISVIVENRFQLMMVEVQEERERAFLGVVLVLSVVAFGLLAGVAFTMVIAIVFWSHLAVIALLVLTFLYALAAVLFYRRLAHLQRNWETLPETLDQLKKDRECLEKMFT